MILIAHRGNIDGPNPREENSPKYIKRSIDHGFFVEIDVWMHSDGSLYLGHDDPQYPTTLEFLQHSDKIICHAKTTSTLQFLISKGIHCFFHNVDDATLTSQGKIWLYPGISQCESGILVMPEWESIDYKGENWIDFVAKSTCYGVCSDYVNLIKDSIDKNNKI